MRITGIVSLMAALLMSVTSFAQIDKFAVSFEGGFGASWMRDNLDSNNDLITYGHLSSLTFQFNFLEFLSVRSGLAYQKKGYYTNASLIDDSGNDLGKTNFQYKYHYGTIPLLLRLTLGQRTRFFLQTGGYVGFLFKNEMVIKAIGDFERTKVKKEDISTTDFGLTAGMGLVFPLADHLDFSVEARYDFGLTDVTNDKNTDFDKAYNNVINLIFGISYGFGKR